MIEIKTTFREFSFDFLKQLVLRVDEASNSKVSTVYYTRYFMSDVIKTMSSDIDPVIKRDLVLAGHVGSLTLDKLQGHTVFLHTNLSGADDAAPNQVYGQDSDGNRLFTAIHVTEVDEIIKETSR